MSWPGVFMATKKMPGQYAWNGEAGRVVRHLPRCHHDGEVDIHRRSSWSHITGACAGTAARAAAELSCRTDRSIRAPRRDARMRHRA
jgi:hypothetical protein